MKSASTSSSVIFAPCMLVARILSSKPYRVLPRSRHLLKENVNWESSFVVSLSWLQPSTSAFSNSICRRLLFHEPPAGGLKIQIVSINKTRMMSEARPLWRGFLSSQYMQVLWSWISLNMPLAKIRELARGC